MFVAPSKIRNPFLSVFEIAFPSIAACPLPNPGRKPHNGDATAEPKNAFAICFEILLSGFVFAVVVFLLYFLC